MGRFFRGENQSLPGFRRFSFADAEVGAARAEDEQAPTSCNGPEMIGSAAAFPAFQKIAVSDWHVNVRARTGAAHDR